MLKKPVSGILDIREAYLVKRRSFQDSDVSPFTDDRAAFLSTLQRYI
jgi:hypothetical protein